MGQTVGHSPGCRTPGCRDSRTPGPAAWALIRPILLLGLGAAAGCSGPVPLMHDGRDGRTDVLLSVIAMDSDGVARDPAHFSAGPISPQRYAEHVKAVLDAMDQFHSNPRFEGKPKKILVFVHGGLNTPDSALAAADAEVQNVMDADYYPIFVNWQSDLIDSYGEHLTTVTQGRKQYNDPVARVLMSPLYLLADLGRAVSRIPLVWANQIASDSAAGAADLGALVERRHQEGRVKQADYDRWAHYAGSDNARKVYADLYRRYRADRLAHPDPGGAHDEIQISIGPDNDVDEGHFIGLLASYVLTSPVKFGTSWIVDGLGKSSWDNMTRRTFMVFEGRSGGNPNDPRLRAKDLAHVDDPLKGRYRPVHLAVTRPATTRETTTMPTPDPPDFDRQGALDYFKNQLAERIKRHAPDNTWEQYEITLVGHSMGSMVLNEWVRRNDEDGMFYKNIVYMAAACSVRDFQRTIVPYLRDHRDPNEPRRTTCFYDLTLHPTADLREKNRPLVGDLPARGSLLVWIDDFLADPATPLDRTLGRWDNILQAAYVIPPAVKGQVTIRAMSLDPDDNSCESDHRAPDPQTHGRFRCYSYWKPEFWHATPPDAYQEQIVAREEARQQAEQKQSGQGP